MTNQTSLNASQHVRMLTAMNAFCIREYGQHTVFQSLQPSMDIAYTEYGKEETEVQVAVLPYLRMITVCVDGELMDEIIFTTIDQLIHFVNTSNFEDMITIGENTNALISLLEEE